MNNKPRTLTYWRDAKRKRKWKTIPLGSISHIVDDGTEINERWMKVNSQSIMSKFMYSASSPY